MVVGWITLDVGEQALIYKLNGSARIEKGPKRMFLFREKFIPLKSYHANQSEYLKIRHKDGRVTHQSGPCAIFKNPLEHDSISVENGTSLDANDILVVYKLNQKSGEVTRHMKHGPTLYIPDADEWLHVFCWHGTDPSNKTHMLPGQQRFTKLRVIPDHFYYNVDEVRTADDALMRIKLMVFYEFLDLERMLNATSDPIADFINCVTADVITFVAKLKYMEFIERSTELNDISNYPLLMERCKVIGSAVTKVVFRGYFASPKLQEMHDKSIKTRNSLKLQFESQEQEQELTDLNLKNEHARMVIEQTMEIQKMEHDHELQRLENSHTVELLKQKELEKLAHMKKKDQAKLEEIDQENRQKLSFYSELHGLDVNLTEFLLSQNPQPDKYVKVVADQNAAVMHLHHN